MTVSRALKADGAVSAATRRRIMQAVDELGDVRDQTAWTLSSKRSGFVVVPIPSLDNSNVSDTARGLGRRLERGGMQMLLGATDYDVGREEDLIGTMPRRRPEAIVVTGSCHTERARRMLACWRRRAFRCWRCGSGRSAFGALAECQRRGGAGAPWRAHRAGAGRWSPG